MHFTLICPKLQLEVQEQHYLHASRQEGKDLGRYDATPTFPPMQPLTRSEQDELRALHTGAGAHNQVVNKTSESNEKAKVTQSPTAASSKNTPMCGNSVKVDPGMAACNRRDSCRTYVVRKDKAKVNFSRSTETPSKHKKGKEPA